MEDDDAATIVIQDRTEIGIVDFDPDRRTAAYLVTPAFPEFTSSYSTTELSPVVFGDEDKPLIT